MEDTLLNQLLEIVKKQSNALELQSQVMLSNGTGRTELREQSATVLHRDLAEPAGTREIIHVTSTATPGGIAQPDSIEQEVLLLVSRIAAYPATELKPSDALKNELGFDSLMMMELQSELKKRYPDREVIIPLEVVDLTIRELVGIVSGTGDPSLAPAADMAMPVEEDHNLPRVQPQLGVEQFPEYAALKLRIENAGTVNPYYRLRGGINKDTVVINGEPYINYSSYNYLGYAGNPDIITFVQEAVAEYGTSVSASRMLSGEIPLHGELEDAVSRFVGTEASLIYTAGHATNVSTIAKLVGKEDIVLHDELSHNSLIQGCLLSGAQRVSFPHNDWEALDRILSRMRHHRRRALIVIEGVYSMDGDIPDLPKFIEIKKKHQAMLYIDEAHSIGTIGATGRGICEYHGVSPAEVDLLMGTLSKAFASCGGYAAGSAPMIEYLKYLSDGFIFSAGITPANAAASLAVIRALEQDPTPVHRLQQNARQFLEQSKLLGLQTGLSGDTPIIPIIVGDSDATLQLTEILYQKGINVYPILYPAVSEEGACVRFFITANHTAEQIEWTVHQVAEGIQSLKKESVTI
ncbi:aminotransferase class I/II-fold pyridoxal phosphate-dependent enzyme [Bacillus sp. FJAT-27264]|uniref:aminotransferase class I/II-fold pyridoxal phosphate-dependent enzyme n=1 Tax=Paenibacillus sp. (strain DSM 101736 / FJAT-27264) TaxID=1850362 RepID=UPI0015861A37|nr:aminotransferase class I/II-fold pyridoxal phosphate-dependent enzyme [Bacillus sp. FJAT-27264]